MRDEGGSGAMGGRFAVIAHVAGRGYWRTALTGGLALVAAFGAMAGPGGAAPATPAAPGQAPTIDPGRASGRANVVSVAPSTGALQFALGSGEVIAETSGSLAQAQSSAADLGLIGSSLTAESCSGADGALTPEQLPQVLLVDNRNGPASAEGAEAPGPIPGTSGGHKEVEATDTPSSSAGVTFIDVEVPGLMTVTGGQAIAQAEVFPGAGREARATVSVDVDLLGAVQLRGLHWSARHRTGGEDGAEGSFSIDALEILGVPIPVEDVEQAAVAINQALAGLGLRLEMPEVERIQEGTVDLVRVTPLRLVLTESPIGQLVVRPALQATQDLRSQLFDALVAADCRLASVLLVGEIGIAVGAGTGTLVASIGGVQATSSTVVVEDLFGAIGGGGLLPEVGPTPAADLPAGGTGTGGAAVGRPAAPVAGGTVPVASTPTAAAGAFDRICENIHPNRKPSCSEGAAAAVGAIGLVATAGVGALDLRRRRPTRSVVEVAS
jgi:hypothetical protein